MLITQIVAVPAALLLLIPTIANATQCPDAPAGMRYKATKEGWIEASMNGGPFEKCLKTKEGDFFGYGYHKTTYACPTFSLVRRGPGLRKLTGEQYYTKSWYLVDKNKEEWPVYELANLYGIRKEKGVEPVWVESQQKLQNGCSHIRVLTAVADGVNLKLRHHYVRTLVKDKPTF